MGGQNSASIGRMRPYEGYQLVQGVSKFRLAKAHCWLAHAFEHANLSGQAAGGEWEWEPAMSGRALCGILVECWTL
jgi:hypothetical protein